MLRQESTGGAGDTRGALETMATIGVVIMRAATGPTIVFMIGVALLGLACFCLIFDRPGDARRLAQRTSKEKK